MKKQCKPQHFLIMNILLILNFLVFWSIRSMWSGIIAIAGKPVPYILMLLITIASLLTTSFSIMKQQNKLLFVFGCILDVLFLGLETYMLSVTLDSLHYFVREFINSALFIGGIGLFIFLCFYAHNYRWFQKKWMPPACITLLLCIGFFVFFDIQLVNGIDKTPVVYAVEDTYQITFTTKAKGEAWVVINGVEYNDTYAGYQKTENDIHKISVPMDALDNAGEYTVYTRAMFLRGPYESLQGTTISKTYKWKGVDTSDGIHYYAFSDNHLASKAPAKAAGYWGEDLDFLIALGDTANWIDHKDELTTLLYLASDITKGEVPVIYARGNHETKGLLADEYYKYVGANGENFYYTFRLKNIWGIVLDVGEDHEDTHAEYAGLARFDAYRAAQTAFLDEILANAENEFDAEGVDYRIALCHIPLTFSKMNDPLAKQKAAWVERLNQMKLSIMFNGHMHELIYADSSIEAGSTLTLLPSYSGKETNNDQYIMADATFPSILVSKRGVAQPRTDKENVFDKVFIGVAASIEGNETVLRFTNEKGEIVQTASPWFKDSSYMDEIHVRNAN